MDKKEDREIVSSTLSICNTPLKLPTVRKVRCRIRPQIVDHNHTTLPLSIVSSKQQCTASYLNKSQNCPEQDTFKVTRCKKYPSLIAIDLDNHEWSQEQTLIQYIKSPRNKSKPNVRLHSNGYHHNRYSSSSTLSIRKQKSDSIIFTHRHYLPSKQRSFFKYSSKNINSITNDVSSLNDATINASTSNSDLLSPINKRTDKTWRLQIRDDLNKDGSRHYVMHKGSDESVRQRRQNKRAKRSEEKKRRIEEKVSKANQRWQKYSNIDYELVFFISRYYDQLPLCPNCRSYFTTYQTQFLAENPRASLDYAADAVLESMNEKPMTFKQAAKARLIKDYDKQTSIIFSLCDTCLTKCEQIRNELKQVNVVQKVSSGPNSPNIQQQPIPTSPFNVDEKLFSPSIVSPISPSVFYTNTTPKENISSPPHQTTITDLSQFYINNMIQYHQIKLQQLFQQSQSIILAQNYPFINDQQQQQYHYDLQSCLQQMQDHCLELLHYQYPGYSLTFPYTPSYNSEYLSYRHQESESESMETTSDTQSDHQKCCPNEYDEYQQSTDDRLTIQTCHGLVEYCNAPLDDFIRGLQVLKCLSNFNCYSS